MCLQAARQPHPPALSCRGCWGRGSHLFPASCHWQSHCRAEHEEGWCLHPSSCGAPCCSVHWGGGFPQSLGSRSSTRSPWGRCGRSRCPCCRCTPCTPRAARSLWGRKGRSTREDEQLEVVSTGAHKSWKARAVLCSSVGESLTK